MSVDRIIYARTEWFFMAAVLFFVLGKIALHSGANYNSGDLLGPGWEGLMGLAHYGLNFLAGICTLAGIAKLAFGYLTQD